VSSWQAHRSRHVVGSALFRRGRVLPISFDYFIFGVSGVQLVCDDYMLYVWEVTVFHGFIPFSRLLTVVESRLVVDAFMGPPVSKALCGWP